MEKLKYSIFRIIVGGILFIGFLPQLHSQKLIKLTVMYTEQTKSFMGKADEQVRLIQDILGRDITLEVSYATLSNYAEPKHRGGEYVRFSFDGTYQVLDEISNHAKLNQYFLDNGIDTFDGTTETDEGDGTLPPDESAKKDYIDENDLSQSLISILASTKPNVVLFIVDEDGPPIVSESIPQDLSPDNSRTFFSIIDATVHANWSPSLALGFFGIFIDKTVTELEEEITTRTLSAENRNLFTCKLSKLNLTSPNKMEVGGVWLEAEVDDMVIDAEESIVILPASPVNKRSYSVIAPAGRDYSLSMVSKRARVNQTGGSCPTSRSTASNNTFRTASPQVRLSQEDKEYFTFKEAGSPCWDEQNRGIDCELLGQVGIQALPNPTDGKLSFEFTLAQKAQIKLELLDIRGKVLRVLAEGKMPKGLNQVHTDVSDLVAGIYIYRLETGIGPAFTGKLIVQ